MKKQILILAIASLVSGMTMSSCTTEGCTDKEAANYNEDAEKDDDSCEYGDIIDPKITINEPTESSYDMTDGKATFPISVDVSDNEELHSVVLVLTNTSKEKEEIRIHLHPDAATVSIDTSFTGSVIHQDYEIKVTAEDHNGNSITEKEYTHIMNQYNVFFSWKVQP